MSDQEHDKEVQTTEVSTSNDVDETTKKLTEDSVAGDLDLSESVVIHAEEEKLEDIDESCSKTSAKSHELDETGSCKSADQNQSKHVCMENLFEDHPYRELLIGFNPSDDQMAVVTVVKPRTLEETPLQDIRSVQQLEQLVQDLLQEKEIGVDLEYSDHGYKALTCLVQISTATTDYIIDAITLKDDMRILNAVFTNPAIVKVFHSSTNDLKWLQEDFQIFVVNMFDTQIAMQALSYQKFGLDVLLKDYDVFKDKEMQREDFRRRPLPPKFKDYARTDSHYLITFYHKLKNRLIEENLLRKVFHVCKQKCGVVYQRVEDAAYVSVETEIKDMHNRQLRVLEELNRWRHERAEYIDKNPGQVLSKSSLKALVLQMPSDKAAILAIGKSKYVGEYVDTIHRILQEGRPPFFENKRKFQQTDFGEQQGNCSFNEGQTVPHFAAKKQKFGRRQRQNFAYYGQQSDEFDLRATLRRGGGHFKRQPRN